MNNVLITGAGIGIGRATALAFASSGYHVFVSDILSTEGQQVTEEIASAGGSAQYIHLDVTDPASVSSAMTEMVEQQTTVWTASLAMPASLTSRSSQI